MTRTSYKLLHSYAVSIRRKGYNYNSPFQANGPCFFVETGLSAKAGRVSVRFYEGEFRLMGTKGAKKLPIDSIIEVLPNSHFKVHGVIEEIEEDSYDAY